MSRTWALVAGAAAWAGLSSTAEAYVGPGAGLGGMAPFLALFALVLVSLCVLLSWPVWSFIRRRRKAKEDARRAEEEGGQDASCGTAQ